jgi:hypothetical protein
LVFKVLAAVSLVLCIATAVMWVRSHWRADSIEWARARTLIRIRTAPGSVRFAIVFGGGYVSGWSFTSNPPPSALYTEGFSFRHNSSGRSGGIGTWDEWMVSFPWSGACLLFAIAPAAWLIAPGHAHDWERSGRCRVCGYDMRATPDRCPECGTAAPPRAVGCPP